jgi:hypothetical protein
MSLKLSLAEILDNLERRIVFHREQAALHTREEELHRSQRSVHEAELEKATQHLETLKTVAVPASELAGLPAALAASPVAKGEADIGSDPRLRELISRILESRPDGEPFGPTAITAEINRRFRDRLARPADVRSVSAALRRMRQHHRIELVREGRSFHEALYTKPPAK